MTSLDRYGRQRGHAHKGRKQIKVEMTRLDMLLDGTLTFDDLDDDEIMRMQLKNRNGQFSGRPTKYIPRELAMEWSNRQRAMFLEKFQGMMPDALQAHAEMIKSRHLAPGDAARLSAIKELYDRAIGKVGQETHLIVDKGPSFEDHSAALIVNMNEVEEDDY